MSKPSLDPSAWLSSTSDAPAIGRGARTILSYAELRSLVNNAHHSIDQLTHRSQGLAISVDYPRAMTDYHLAYLVALLLAMLPGRTSAPLPPSLREAQYRTLLHEMDIDQVILVAANPALRRAAAALDIAILDLCPPRGDPQGSVLIPGQSKTAPRRDRIHRQGGLLLRTSATTGRAKIVLLQSRAMLDNAANIAATLHLQPGERCCNPMPLFHVHGLIAGLLAPLVSGGCAHLANVTLANVVRNAPCHWITAAPSIYQALLQRITGDTTGGSAPPFPALRFLRSSSAPLAPELQQRMEDVFQRPVVQAYAMSEASHQITSTTIQQRRLGSVGQAVGCEVRIRSTPQGSGRGGWAAARSEGEVYIRGPHIIKSYQSARGAPGNQAPGDVSSNGASTCDTPSLFFRGWLKTGDLGFFDEDGFLYLSGRSKELIIRAGENIHPLEVENALLQHPQVRQAACFALPDALRGEEVAAAIVANPGHPNDVQLREFLTTRLAPHKIPRKIFFRKHLPLGASGKIQRRRLQEIYHPKKAEKPGG